jgi:hypothetical protein
LILLDAKTLPNKNTISYIPLLSEFAAGKTEP